MQRSLRQDCFWPSCSSCPGFLPSAISLAPPPTFPRLGLPAPSLVAWATCLFELAAGVLIVIGFQTRAAALLLAAFSIAAGFIGHYGQGGDDPTLAFMHSQALMKDVAIAGGFLALAVAGAGAWSVDAGLGR